MPALKITTEVTLEGITLRHYDSSFHKPGTLSRDEPGPCRQGGVDTCSENARFSVTSPKFSIASCSVHLMGALQQAKTMIG